jgi:iron complex transport system permease protein
MALKRKVLLPLLFLLLILAVILGITQGSVNIPLTQLLLKENRAILSLRLLRILTGLIAGSGLAVSGVVLQAILRNPLAEPYLLGTSSGAGLGAVIAIVLGLSRIYFPIAAFAGAILSIILVYFLARQNNRIAEQSLILSGVVVSVALSAIIVFLISLSPDEALHGLTWWLWGSLQSYDLKLVVAISFLALCGIGVIYIFAQDLNAMSIGEEEAKHLGIDIESVKKILILVTALITAGLVCVCGIIGFVGLIIPHMMRLTAGPNHKILIPATCLASAVFMVVCDTVSRTLIAPLEIPIGVITALLGAPIFILLLRQRQKVK